MANSLQRQRLVSTREQCSPKSDGGSLGCVVGIAPAIRRFRSRAICNAQDRASPGRRLPCLSARQKFSRHFTRFVAKHLIHCNAPITNNRRSYHERSSPRNLSYCLSRVRMARLRKYAGGSVALVKLVVQILEFIS